jgi:hypothetical protein
MDALWDAVYRGTFGPFVEAAREHREALEQIVPGLVNLVEQYQWFEGAIQRAGIQIAEHIPLLGNLVKAEEELTETQQRQAAEYEKHLRIQRASAEETLDFADTTNQLAIAFQKQWDATRLTADGLEDLTRTGYFAEERTRLQTQALYAQGEELEDLQKRFAALAEEEQTWASESQAAFAKHIESLSAATDAQLAFEDVTGAGFGAMPEPTQTVADVEKRLKEVADAEAAAREERLAAEQDLAERLIAINDAYVKTRIDSIGGMSKAYEDYTDDIAKEEETYARKMEKLDERRRRAAGAVGSAISNTRKKIAEEGLAIQERYIERVEKNEEKYADFASDLQNRTQSQADSAWRNYYRTRDKITRDRAKATAELEGEEQGRLDEAAAAAQAWASSELAAIAELETAYKEEHAMVLEQIEERRKAQMLQIGTDLMIAANIKSQGLLFQNLLGPALAGAGTTAEEMGENLRNALAGIEGFVPTSFFEVLADIMVLAGREGEIAFGKGEDAVRRWGEAVDAESAKSAAAWEDQQTAIDTSSEKIDQQIAAAQSAREEAENLGKATAEAQGKMAKSYGAIVDGYDALESGKAALIEAEATHAQAATGEGEKLLAAGELQEDQLQIHLETRQAQIDLEAVWAEKALENNELVSLAIGSMTEYMDLHIDKVWGAIDAYKALADMAKTAYDALASGTLPSAAPRATQPYGEGPYGETGVTGYEPLAQGGARIMRSGLVYAHEEERIVPKGAVLAPIPAYREPYREPRGVAARGRGGGDTIVNLTVEGTVIAERDLATTVRKELLKTTKRNVDSGF